MPDETDTGPDPVDEAPPINTGKNLVEPDMTALHQSLANSIHTVRQNGRSPATARESLFSAMQNNTTPAARIAQKQDNPEPDLASIFSRAPVAAKQIAQSPGTAAAFGSNNEVLKQLAESEEAFAGEYKKQAEQVKENTDKAIAAQDNFTKNFFGSLPASYYQQRMVRARAQQAITFGEEDPQHEIDYQEAKKKYEYWAAKSSAPKVVGGALQMAEQMGEQALTGVAAAAPIAAVSALAAPETGGISLAGMAPAGIAFNAGMAGQMGWDAMGGAYDRFLSMPTTDGSPINKDVAKGAAIAVGVVNGVAAEFGLKLMGKALGPLLNKFGGGKVGQTALEELIGNLVQNGGYNNALIKIATAGTKTSAVNAAFAFINTIATGAGEQYTSTQQSDVVPFRSSKDILKEALSDAWDAKTSGFLFGVGLAGVTYGGGRIGSKAATKALEFHERGLPVVWEFSQGEAKENPERVKDTLNAVADHYDDHKTGPGESAGLVEVPAQELRQMQKDDVPGERLPDGVERSTQKAESVGQEVAITTPDYAAEVKPLEGSDKLVGHERFGDTLTQKEQEELGKLVKAREAVEKDPVEEETAKVAQSIKAELTAGGVAPERAGFVAGLYAESIRTAAMERAKELGTDPHPFEDVYAQKPVVMAGARENAVLGFEKKLQTIVQEARTSARREGAPQTPGKKTPKQGKLKAPLEKLQEAFGKAFGQTAFAYRVEGADRPGGELPEGAAFLRAEDALKASSLKPGTEVVPVQIRPEDVTGADGRGRVTTLPLSAERVLPHTPEALRALHTKEGQQKLSDGKEGKLFGTLSDAGPFSLLTQTGFADKSTLLHEMGHYIYNIWREFAPERAKAIDSWLGVEPGKEPTTEQHEKFAEGLETFFREGIAPNKGMIGTFDTLARWMRGSVDIVQGRVQLDAESRGMFERLFAMQDEIDSASKVLGLDPDVVFEGSLTTKEDKLQHRELMAQAKRESIEKANKAAAKANPESTEARKEIAELRAWAAAKVHYSDINNVFSWLKNGVTLDGRDLGLLEKVKLNRDEVKLAGYDPDDFKGLVEPKGAKPLTGYDPDTVGETIGLTGRELMEALKQVEPFDVQADQAAEQMFKDRHPEYADITSYAKTKGLLAAHNKATEKLQLWRLKKLAEYLNDGISENQIKYALERTVRDYMETIKAREINPLRAYRAEAKGQKDLREAIGKGDFEGARDAQRRVALNHMLFNMMSEAKTDLTDTVERMKFLAKDTSTRARINRGGQEYLTVIDHLLTGLGFRELPPGLSIEQAAALENDKSGSLRGALKTIHDRGESFPLDNQFSEPSGIKPWQQMEYPMLREVFAAIETAEHLAGQRDLVTVEGKKVARELLDRQLSEAVVESARIKGTDITWRPVEDTSKHDIEPKIGDKRRRFSGALQRPEFMFRVLDRGLIGGFIDRVINKPIQEGLARAEKLQEQFRAGVEEALKEVKDNPGDMYERIKAPNGEEFSKRQVLMQLAYFGDARNWDIMLRAEDNKLPGSMTYLKTREWFQQLIHDGTITPGHIESVNKLVRLTGSLWNEIRALKEKETGVHIDPVSAKPEVFDTPEGGKVTLEGGYIPTVYDYKRGGQATPIDDGSSIFSPIQVRAGIPQSFTLERSAGGLNIPLAYDLHLLGSHMMDISRYVSLYDALTTAKAAIEGPNFRKAVSELYGSSFYDQFDPFIKDLGRNAGSEIPRQLGEWARAASRLKYITNLNLYGFKFAMATQQLTGSIAGIDQVGWGNFIKAVGKSFNINERDRVDRESAEVKSALHMVDAALPASAMDQIYRENSPSARIRASAQFHRFMQNYAMFWIKFFTRQSSMINYMAGEMRAKEILTERNEAARASGGAEMEVGGKDWNDEVKHIADQTVRFADSSSSYKDLPKFFRENKYAWSFFNLAAGYSNNLFNHITASGYNFKRGEYARAMSELAYVVALPAILSAIPAMRYTAQKNKNLTDKEQLGYGALNAGAQVLSTVGRTIPFAGDLTLAGIHNFLDTSPLKDKVDFFGARPLNLPIIGNLENAEKYLGSYWKHNEKGTITDHETDRLKYTLTETAGYAGELAGFGYPGKASSDAFRMFDKVRRGEYKSNPSQFFWELATPGHPYDTGKKGKK